VAHIAGYPLAHALNIWYPETKMILRESMSWATTLTANIKKQITTFSTIMNNRFDEISANLANLATTLTCIEPTRPKKDTVDDIHKVINNWKKFEEFFARHKNSPPRADPPQLELTTSEIMHKGGAPPTMSSS